MDRNIGKVKMKAPVGVLDPAILDQVLGPGTVHDVDGIPIPHLFIAFGGAEYNRLLFRSLGDQTPLYQDSVFTDAVAIGVFFQKFDYGTRQDDQSAPVRYPDQPADLDPALPDRVPTEGLVPVAPADRYLLRHVKLVIKLVILCRNPVAVFFSISGDGGGVKSDLSTLQGKHPVIIAGN